MFFLHEDERTITIHPSFLGPNTRRYIRDQLFRDVEGTMTGEFYYICIMDLAEDDISEGRVVPGSSYTEYTVHFKAIVWKPFPGEVIDGKVHSVSEAGFFVYFGPIRFFVSKAMIPPDVVYNANATPAQWTDHGDQVIEKGTMIRLRCKGLKPGQDEIYGVGTIREDYLGVLVE